MSECDNRFTKDDAYRTLDTVNMWINNCDTKASIVLGAIGIIFTILFSSDIIGMVADIFEKAFSSKSVLIWMYNVIVCLSILSIVLGLFFLLKVIIPRIINKYDANTPQFNSLMFYGSVAKKDNQVYYNEVMRVNSDKKIIKDLLFQINSASKICSAKFKNFKIGIIFFGCGIIIFIFLMIMGYFLIL